MERKMARYTQKLVEKFQTLYKKKFGEGIEYEAAERELYELAHLIKKLTIK